MPVTTVVSMLFVLQPLIYYSPEYSSDIPPNIIVYNQNSFPWFATKES